MQRPKVYSDTTSPMFLKKLRDRHNTLNNLVWLSLAFIIGSLVLVIKLMAQLFRITK